jgi:hypothetical protein
MRKSSPDFLREETVQEIRYNVRIASAELQLLRLKTETFRRYVNEAAIYLESAKRYARELK